MILIYLYGASFLVWGAYIIAEGIFFPKFGDGHFMYKKPTIARKIICWPNKYNGRWHDPTWWQVAWCAPGLFFIGWVLNN